MRKLVQVINKSDNVIYEYIRSSGFDIHPGDTIKLWSSEPRIVHLCLYHGPFAYLYKHGARLADFSDHKSEVTIDNDAIYDVNAHIVERQVFITSPKRQRQDSERVPIIETSQVAPSRIARIAHSSL
jgi:hypothetical protein